MLLIKLFCTVHIMKLLHSELQIKFFLSIHYQNCQLEYVLRQENPADAVKLARRGSVQKLLQFDVFRFISPNSISPNFKSVHGVTQ